MNTSKSTAIYSIGVMLVITLSLVPAATPRAMATEDATPPPRPSLPIVQASYGKLPLSFEANHGQWDPSVQFVTRGRGHTLFLTPSEAVLTLRTDAAKAEGRTDHAAQPKLLSNPSTDSQSVVRMRFAGADPQAEMMGLEPLPGIVNYFIGDDPTKWRTNIPTYQKVGYKDLYPGIDLVYYGNQGHLEYDLVVAPGADPSQITLAFEGAEQIAVDEEGDLLLTLAPSSTETAERAATLRLHKPVVYQMDEQDEKHLLAGTYVLNATTAHQAVALIGREMPQVAFQIASYDASRPIIIDPVLSWATYLGSGGDDVQERIAVDPAGHAYVMGTTDSSSFPGTADSAIQSVFGGGITDVFITKLNAAGTALVYATYLGGNDHDVGNGIAVDAGGNAYVTGYTVSSNFPGTAGSAIQSTFGGGGNFDAFVAKLNATGTALVYATYLGGNESDVGNGIAVDAGGNAYVTGYTHSSNFPGTAGSAIQSRWGGGSDAFVTKINVAGTALVYATYLGGSGGDLGNGIAVDAAGNAYVTGYTTSSDFPGTAGSLIQNTFGGDFQDAFVTKLNAAGTALVYATYLGGNRDDNGSGIAVDATGNAYVTGWTRSPNFPGTEGSAIQSMFGGFFDVFITKLNAVGTALVYATYLGGNGSDRGDGIAVDAGGHAYVTGTTLSPNFPGTAGSAIQSTLDGHGDAFVTKLNATGTGLVYATYLGGNGDDGGDGIAVDTVGNAYVTGSTSSSNFPGTEGSAIQSTLGGGADAFVAKITSATIVNDLVTLVPLAATYRTSTDPSGCPAGFVGKFGFDAQLTNENGSPPLSDLAVKVTALSNGNVLHNADGGNGGVGSMLTVPKQSGYADGSLSPGESVVVHFSICLKVKKPFTFVVDVLGMH